MEVKMYKRNNESAVAKIELDEGNGVSFWENAQKVAGIPMFKDRSKKIGYTLMEEEETIRKITKRCNTEVILACNEKIFKQILESTQMHELDVEMFITQKRKIVHYAAFGIEPAVLLISCAY